MNEKIEALLNDAAVPYTMHTHDPFRTVDDMVNHFNVAPEQMLKTVALWIKNGDYIFAALRGSDRVDYKKVAKLFGVSRRNVRPMAPETVTELHEYVVGGVSPFVFRPDTHLLIDDSIDPDENIYTGGGLVTNTLEMRFGDLVRVNGGRLVEIGRASPT